MAESTPEHVRKSERQAARKRGEFVGFVGCSRLGVLKVRVADQSRKMRVLCPACSEIHATGDAMPRALLPGELVTLVAEDTPMAVDPDAPAPAAAPAPPRPRTPAPSAEQILAAISTDPHTPAEMTIIAAELGYPDLSTLRRRIQRMNTSAEDQKESPPFLFQRIFGPGRPTTIRRAE
jgi:hypothetical protein